MSLISETTQTVLDYSNLTAAKIVLGQPTTIRNGINFVKLVGRVDLTGAAADIYPFINVQTGQPLNVSNTLIWGFIMQTNPALVDDSTLEYHLVGISNADPSDYTQYSFYGGLESAENLNKKAWQIPADSGVDGNFYETNLYSTLGIRVSGTSTVTSGTIYISYWGIQI